MFSSSNNKGFSMTFDNGNTVSVQWGPSNYCDPLHEEGRGAPLNAPARTEMWKAKNAEVSAWDSDGRKHRFDHDTVEGLLSPNEVSKFIGFVANNKLNTEE